MSSVEVIRPKSTKIVIGGEEHTLKYDLNAFAELEEYYGSIDDAMNAAEKGKIKALRALLWAGIIHEYLDDKGSPTIKPHELGAMISMEDLSTMFGTLNEAIQGALPEDTGKPGPKRRTKPDPLE